VITQLERRLRFDHDRRVMHLDVSGLRFEHPVDVDIHFDAIEDSIAASGERHWYFLIDLTGTAILPAACKAYTGRVHALNLHHALGSARYGATPDIASALATISQQSGFNMPVFPDEATALRYLQDIRDANLPPRVDERTLRFQDLYPRVSFDTNRRIVEIDMSDMTLHHARDVADLFDHVEARVVAMGRPMRWYALVNYHNAQVMPAAWVEYARRGRDLNTSFSLATLRYNVAEDEAENIRARSASAGFAPNIFATRAEALAQLDLLRSMREA
jgi:hypothetical protein